LASCPQFCKENLIPGVLVLFRQAYVDTMPQAFWKEWDYLCGTQEHGTFDSAAAFLETNSIIKTQQDAGKFWTIF